MWHEALKQDPAVAEFVRSVHGHLDIWLEEAVMAQAGEFVVKVLKVGPPEGATGPVRLCLTSDDGNGGVDINLDPATLRGWKFPGTESA